MSVYSRQTASALKLIKQKGMLVTFRKIVNGAPENDLVPWKPGASVTQDFSVSICFLPVGRVKFETLHYAKDMEISESSEIGLMGKVDFEPKVKDVIIRNGVELSIKNIIKLAPNGEVILYTLHFES